MKVPNWFKVIWWLAISATITWYLRARYPDLVAGDAVAADIFVFFVWVALLLVPIFQEVEFFGMKFKQEIEKAKEDLRLEINSVRAEVRNAIDVRTTFNPQITIPVPPPDSQLGDIENRIKKAVSEALAANGVATPSPTSADLAVSDDVAFLFATRYGLERELRDLARERNLEIGRRRVAGLQLSAALMEAGVIGQSLYNAIREVYSISSPAIHAEDVTAAQVAFVREVGPPLVATLKALRNADRPYSRKS
jgi:hypothetical protein